MADFSGLVQQVKDWQRKGEGEKQSWYHFVTQKGSPNFDPGRHDAAALQEFLGLVNDGAIDPTQYQGLGLGDSRGGSVGGGCTGSGGKRFNVDMKPGDWICQACGDLCFASRTACKMCGAPKPADAGAGGCGGFSGGGYAGGGCGGGYAGGCGGYGGGCGMASGGGYGGGCSSGGKGGGKGGGKQFNVQQKPGDWICHNCGDLVFASRNVCKSCGTPKRVEGGGGGGGCGGSVGCGGYGGCGGADMFMMQGGYNAAGCGGYGAGAGGGVATQRFSPY